MIDRDELWRRVHTALDARLDPLGDEGVVEALVEQPGEYRAVERLVGRLAGLEGSALAVPLRLVAGGAEVAVPRGSRRVIGWAVAAVAAAASIALLLRARPEPQPTQPISAGSESAPSLARESRVLRWDVSVERRVTAPPEQARAAASGPVADAASGSRLVHLDVRVEHRGQRRGGTRVVLGPDGALSITQATGSPFSTGTAAGTLLAAKLPTD